MQLLRELGVLVLWLSLFSGLVYVFKSISKSGWRLAALEAFVFTGFLAWSITETLSAFEAVTLTGIVVSWGIIGLVVSVLVLRILREPERPTLTKALAALATNARQLPKGTVFLLVYLFFSVSVLGLIAIVAPPNSSDAMTYHMSRVMHWQQNRSLDMYPTGILRQLDLGPMAEIGILHLQTLAGSDRLANLVQFFSLLGSLIGVTLIAELLGGNVQAQVFSVMTVLTLPMGILQATSAQNDLVVSLWLVCFVTFLLVQMRGRITLPLCLFAGIALGLALNTKATAYQFGLPFGLWFFSHLLKRERSKTIKPLAFLLGAAAFILVPQYVRNANLFSNPFGTGHDLRNSLISPATAASNILRNLAIHAATPIEPLNDYFEERIEAVHEAVGLDMHDSRTTWMETHFTVDFSNQDDLAGNPLHLALILLAMPGLLLSNRRDRIALLTCAALGFVLFCVLLKWQPWASRLHLPLFILVMPATVLSLGSHSKSRLGWIVVILLAFFAIPYLFMNPIRPLVGPKNILRQDRWSQYFMDRPVMVPYTELGEKLLALPCERIGLVSYHDAWEYPIWVQMQSSGRQLFIQDVLVRNISNQLEKDFMPCAILATYPLEGERIEYHGEVLIKSFYMEPLSLFVSLDYGGLR